MYAKVQDQPPSAPLPHSFSPPQALGPGPTASPSLLTSALFISPPARLFHIHSSLVSSLPPARASPISKHPLATSQSPPARSSRRANVNAPMHRSPYSRETTDISDQELQQILESENISGLPAPYCLVPNYDGQFPISPAALWQQQQQQQLQARQPGNSTPSPNSSANSHDAAGSSARSSGAADSTTPAAEPTRRRTRTTLTPYQLRVLFRVWERTQYPSSDLRFRLANSLLMTPRNVQIWFQNQRQKTKERAEMRRRTHSPNTSTAQPAAISGIGQMSASVHGLERPISAISLSGGSPPESPFRYSHMPPAPPGMGSPIGVSHPHQFHPHHSVPATAHTSPFPGGTASQTTSPVTGSGGSAMLTPPALYSQTFSQQHQQQPPHQAHHFQRHSIHTHVQLHPPTMRASPPQSMPPPHHHRHSMHSLQHLRQQAQMQPAQSIHLALPPPPPPAQAARVQMPPPTLTSQQKELKQQRLPPRLPPPVVTSHQVPTPYIPSPTTPTTIGRRGSMQSPSPIPSLQRQFSPPLSSAGTSQTVREHPENRRTRLASILNPIQPQSSVDGGMPVPRAPEPLPSLGSVLARVQSAEGTITPQHREPSPSVGSKASSPEKWRPW